MKPSVIGIDPQSVLAMASRTRGRDSRGQGLFDNLLAQVSNSGLNQSSAVTAPPSDATAASAASNEPLPARQTPLAVLQQKLSDSNVSVERLQVPASDRSRLEEVLVNCGYKEEDAKQLLDKSSNSDGSINLGALFALLPKYVPVQGPQFFIKVDDKPLLSQVLKGLGVPSEDVNRFMEGLEQVGGERLRVTGLPALLAQAGGKTGEKSGQVDRSVLSDLLGKMGLATDEINSLLAKAYDGQDRANPKAVLALLQSAANRQDQVTADTLKDLSQRIKVAPEDQKKPLDADRLRAQFIQAVKDVESGLQAKNGEFSKDLTQALNALSKGQGEGKLDELIPRLVKAETAGQAPEPGQGSAQAAQVRSAGTAANPVQTGLNGDFQRQTGDQGQPLNSGRTPQTQTAATFGAAMGQADSASSSQSSAPRGVLPSYVVRQVGLAMTQMVAREQTTLRLELKPPSLGELNLELSVKDGAVTAKLVAENAGAKQALEAGMDQLKQDLANQGLKLARVEITVNPDAERGQAQAQARGDGGGGERSGSSLGGQDYPGAAAALDEDLGVSDYMVRAAGARISVFA